MLHVYTHNHPTAFGDTDFSLTLKKISKLLLAGVSATTVALLAWNALPVVRDSADIRVYEGIAQNVENALRDQTVSPSSEYPPLATSLIAFVELHRGPLPFSDAWVVAMIVSIGLCALYCRIHGNSGDAGLFFAACAISFWLLGKEIVFARFDIFVCLLCFLSWQSHNARRNAESGLFLALAACLKAIPILAVPALLLCTHRSRRGRVVWGIVTGCAIAAALCFALLGVEYTIGNAVYFIRYHNERGILIESMWSGVGMLLAKIAGQTMSTGFDHSSVTNTGIPPGVATLAKVSIVFLWACSVLMLLFSPARRRDYGSLLLVTLLGFLALSPILSPQYFVWVVPLIVFWSFMAFRHGTDRRHAILVGVVGICLAAATNWIFPQHYFDVVDQSTLLAVLMLNVRNLLTVLAIPLLLSRVRRTTRVSCSCTALTCAGYSHALIPITSTSVKS